ncbi:MAG: hypothetical protein ACKO96_25235, partial [Flammeovirgaceae bacterium]
IFLERLGLSVLRFFSLFDMGQLHEKFVYDLEPFLLNFFARDRTIIKFYFLQARSKNEICGFVIRRLLLGR